MNDADKKLSGLLDDCASDGAEYFDDCGGEESAIIAAFLRSSHADEAFSEIDMGVLNEMVACILVAPSKTEHERRRVALVAYLTNAARDSAKDYVDKILPGKRHIYRHYAWQDAQADRQQTSLTDALTGIVRTYYRFS